MVKIDKLMKRRNKKKKLPLAAFRIILYKPLSKLHRGDTADFGNRKYRVVNLPKLCKKTK